MSVLNILATSHGTDSSEGRQAIALVRAELQKLLHERSTSDGREYKVHEAYVDVQTPSVDEAAQALPDGEPCVIVPVLLSTGFHTQVDLRRAARTSGVKDIHIAASLGPDARLAHLQRTRLEEIGWHEKIAAGSADCSRGCRFIPPRWASRYAARRRFARRSSSHTYQKRFYRSN